MYSNFIIKFIQLKACIFGPPTVSSVPLKILPPNVQHGTEQFDDHCNAFMEPHCCLLEAPNSMLHRNISQAWAWSVQFVWWTFVFILLTFYPSCGRYAGESCKFLSVCLPLRVLLVKQVILQIYCCNLLKSVNFASREMIAFSGLVTANHREVG